MVIVLKKDCSADQKLGVCSYLEEHSFKINEIVGEEDTVIAAVGRAHTDVRQVELLPGVAKVIPISKPYKLASREFKREDTIVQIPNGRGQAVRIGGRHVVAIAGPCAVESREQIDEIACQVAQSGAVMLRAGVFEPSSSPYGFHGLGEVGLSYLKEAGERWGLPIVTEIGAESLIPITREFVDVYQISPRNMQDFDLLKKVGATGKSVILKRSYTATLEELLMSAEYLLSSGTDNVILCERGIRTFEHATRNTLDVSAIPVLRSLTHLPILVDPSRAVGIRDKIPPMALASIAGGADGIMVEVHGHPERALIDGAQSLLPQQFDKLMHDIEALAPVIGKSVAHIRETSSSVVSPATASNAQVVCAYSGKKGAYAEQAILRYFGEGAAEAVALDSFDEVFQSVVDGKADYGMVPIENSLAGSVFQNYDNFGRFEDVSIAAAITLNIRHALLGVKGSSIEDIKTVYSHPQAMSQCKRFLDSHKGWNLVDSPSTATAAQDVARRCDRSCAAIAAATNAALYGLEVLREDIEDDPGNFTRFVVIQANHTQRAQKSAGAKDANRKADMASFIFKTKNEPGALYNVLGVFNECAVNLTRLESRPIAGQPWRYWFYADAQITSDDPTGYTASLMQRLRAKVEEVRLLGIYRQMGK